MAPRSLQTSSFHFNPKKHRLRDFDPENTGDFKSKQDAKGKLESDIKALAELQDVLYAQNDYALLLIFQAMDAAGKDGTIKHVMSGVNPQGCQVYSFKSPSSEELDHDYLWRTSKCLPERGRIGIFNRSYYEEVLVVRVQDGILQAQQLPDVLRTKSIWTDRYRQMNDFERYLTENGIQVMKFFLNVSKKEQRKRFLERLDQPEKNWKFSHADLKVRGSWGEYMNAYEDVFLATSTEWAPWHIIPADNKWFTRTAVAGSIVNKLKSLNLQYPTLSDDQRRNLDAARKLILSEK